ncbi:copper resistance system multicopper oxidase [Tistrella bauzanensis]|uniref:copper resistance system multicopper oxidase n=1 Tax=Tistrella TaxID=171436 RepID=UPI0031F6E51A
MTRFTTAAGLSRRSALKLGGIAGIAGLVTIHNGRRSFASAAGTYELAITADRIIVDGVSSKAVMMGGTVPAPTMRWREGEEVVVHATNRLDEPTSIHWHGLLIAGVMDGAPGFNGYVAIQPGETYTYRFRLRQAGTYWYHSHSALQEQAGMYGAIVIDPAGPEPVRADRDYVVVLSDHTAEDPMRVMSNLKADAGHYNQARRTLMDFIRDARDSGFNAALSDRLDWGAMRMDPTDLADVAGYRFLVNGRGPEDNWTGLFTPGERVRLRIINASAMSIFDVRIPDLPMTVFAADGQTVQPVRVDEFRFGVGETYDVVVLPREGRAYTIVAEPIDRTGHARATLAPRRGMSGPVPEPRPRTLLTMADMGMGDMGMGGRGMDGMDHSTMAMAGNGMAGMDHAAMADTTDRGRPLGWADASTPPGDKALDYADLVSATVNGDDRAPDHVIEVRLTGIMDRYMWSLNGRPFGKDQPIRVRQGDRIRITYVNTTMMAHPMHLHGMFVELENGQGRRMPRKHVVLVPPGKTISVVLTASEPGEWPFHCHLLYHMAAGMMTRFIVDDQTA